MVDSIQTEAPADAGELRWRAQRRRYLLVVLTSLLIPGSLLYAVLFQLDSPHGGLENLIVVLAVLGAFSWPFFLMIVLAESLALYWLRPRRDGNAKRRYPNLVRARQAYWKAYFLVLVLLSIAVAIIGFVVSR